MRERRATSTSNFGTTGRESHDASAFYRRFRAPELSTDDAVPPPHPVPEPFVHGDARDMSAVDSGSVALVVTSPPYFAGKVYEEELERDGVPGSYLEYLAMLSEVFAECRRTLEPGGRVAVNVANLGRKPYRSLAADVIRILQDDLGFLLRGELVWVKAAGASGSCAWGSYRSAVNPVFRDVSERVVVASKGRFDRARSVRRRATEGLPHETTIGAEDFMAHTIDTWAIPAESASRVGHPAPFPVELPEQLIRLYTFRHDLVLDPFMGSGSTLVAAATLDRRYVGYDLDAGYVEMARQRVAEALSTGVANDAEEPPVADGATAHRIADDALPPQGSSITGRNRRISGAGLVGFLVAEDAAGDTWRFEVCGPNTSRRGGLSRLDAVWRALGRAGGDSGIGRRRRHPPRPAHHGASPLGRGRHRAARPRTGCVLRCRRARVGRGKRPAASATPRVGSPAIRSPASGPPRRSTGFAAEPAAAGAGVDRGLGADGAPRARGASGRPSQPVGPPAPGGPVTMSPLSIPSRGPVGRGKRTRGSARRRWVDRPMAVPLARAAPSPRFLPGGAGRGVGRREEHVGCGKLRPGPDRLVRPAPGGGRGRRA